MSLSIKSSSYIRFSKENYFLAIKKLIEVYNIKLDCDVDKLMNLSFKELKTIHHELKLQLPGLHPHVNFSIKNYGNKISNKNK